MKKPSTLLSRLNDLRRRGGRELNPAVTALAVGGVELRVPADGYRWHGLKRRADPSFAHILLQATYDGLGVFQNPAGRFEQTPGRAFIALLPSDHEYFLPPRSNRWGLFYLVLFQRYAVDRLASRCGSGGISFDLPHDSRPAQLMISLLELLGSRSSDVYSIEIELLTLTIELERHLDAASGDETKMLLDLVRARVMKQLSHPPDVQSLADQAGMSRTAFSHRFAKLTGQSPARYMTQLRLAEVRRMLLDTKEPLKSIAAQTGFADANHLCKVFRKAHHLSPGAFRLGGRGSYSAIRKPRPDE